MKHIPVFLFLFSFALPHLLLGQIKMADSSKLSSTILYCNDREDNVEKPLRLDWIQKDIDIIKTKINLLPNTGYTLTGIQKLFPDFLNGKRNSHSLTQYLGYGLTSTLHTIYSGYGSFDVDAIYFGNYIIKLRLTIGNHKEIIDKYLLDVQ